MTHPEGVDQNEESAVRLRPNVRAPRRAEVTLDLSQVPAKDIPALTFAKWAYSSKEDWPLLHSKKPAVLGSRRTLDPDDARQVFYDDLKRAVNQYDTQDNRVVLTWDDDLLRLTVNWSTDKRRLPQVGHPIFAKLDEIVHIARNVPTYEQSPDIPGLVTSDIRSRIAFESACRHLSREPGAAFRVELTNLNLPEGAAAGLYRGIKQRCADYNVRYGVGFDPRVSFDEDTKTIEFQNWRAISFSGAIDVLVYLAQYATPHRSDHEPTAGSGSLTYNTAGYREIRRAFGMPGHASARQYERRIANADLTPATIESTYVEYAKALDGHLDKIYDKVEDGGKTGRYGPAFRQLSAHGGLIIGESHDVHDANKFVSDHLKELKKSGFTHIVSEAFTVDQQDLLDQYIQGNPREPLPTVLEKHVSWLEERWDNKGARGLLDAARKHKIPVCAAETDISGVRVGDRITGQWADKYGGEKRCALYNLGVSNLIKNLPAGSVPVVVAGERHVHSTDYSPGIAELCKLAAVKIGSESGKLKMVPLREELGARQGIIAIREPAREVRENPSQRPQVAAYNRHQHEQSVNRSTAPLIK